MPFTAHITEVTPLGGEIKSFRLSTDAGFTGAAPGAHIDVHLPNGLIRQYSLWDWDPDGRWIAIAVKAEPTGRGGSAWMHANLKAGDTLSVGPIRNNFVLDEAAGAYILIAGGIGVTPLVPMARRLVALGKPVQVYYLARGESAAGFQDILAGLGLGAALHTHIDARDGLFDIAGCLAAAPSGTQLYFCGPEGLLKAALAASADWPAGTVHYERFSADTSAAVSAAPPSGFIVTLQKSGQSFEVPEGKSILQVLLDNGLNPDFGCMSGACGACLTPVIEGEVEHQDFAYPAEQHDADRTMCICVSRPKSGNLVLDL